MGSRSSTQLLEPSRGASILFIMVPEKRKRPAQDANWRILIALRRRHWRKERHCSRLTARFATASAAKAMGRSQARSRRLLHIFLIDSCSFLQDGFFT